MAAASPLPALDSSWIKKLRLCDRPHRFSAYSMILRAEQHAVQQQAEEDIVSARAVGYLLLEFDAQSGTFGDGPCASIVRQVRSLPRDTGGKEYNEHSVISDVGKLCRDKLLRVFRSSAAPYPPPSSHSSRPSFDTLEAMIMDSIKPTGKDYRTSRKRALARDGYRCIVSGMFDETSLNKSAALQDTAERDGANGVAVHVCHILKESAARCIDPEGTGDHGASCHRCHDHSGAFWANSCYRCPQEIRCSWARNLLSLEPNLHSKFDRLNLWFERTPQPNRYKVCVFHKGDEGYIRRNFVGPKPHDGAPMVVEFTSKYEEVPPPDPQLLALHATCARVAHMSSAAEFFDKLEWDAEETKVLASDGSSALLLDNLISPFAVIRGVA